VELQQLFVVFCSKIHFFRLKISKNRSTKINIFNLNFTINTFDQFLFIFWDRGVFFLFYFTFQFMNIFNLLMVKSEDKLEPLELDKW
jgi:hypothetical protein